MEPKSQRRCMKSVFRFGERDTSRPAWIGDRPISIIPCQLPKDHAGDCSQIPPDAPPAASTGTPEPPRNCDVTRYIIAKSAYGTPAPSEPGESAERRITELVDLNNKLATLNVQMHTRIQRLRELVTDLHKFTSGFSGRKIDKLNKRAAAALKNDSK